MNEGNIESRVRRSFHEEIIGLSEEAHDAMHATTQRTTTTRTTRRTTITTTSRTSTRTTTVKDSLIATTTEAPNFEGGFKDEENDDESSTDEHEDGSRHG